MCMTAAVSHVHDCHLHLGRHRQAGLQPVVAELVDQRLQDVAGVPVLAQRLVDVLDVEAGQQAGQPLLGLEGAQSEVIRAIWCSGSASRHNPR